jgi:hypothetical protein
MIFSSEQPSYPNLFYIIPFLWLISWMNSFSELKTNHDTVIVAARQPFNFVSKTIPLSVFDLMGCRLRIQIGTFWWSDSFPQFRSSLRSASIAIEISRWRQENDPKRKANSTDPTKWLFFQGINDSLQIRSDLKGISGRKTGNWKIGKLGKQIGLQSWSGLSGAFQVGQRWGKKSDEFSMPLKSSFEGRETLSDISINNGRFKI